MTPLGWLGCKTSTQTNKLTKSVDPDQLASEANWSGSTVCKGRAYLGSAGPGFWRMDVWINHCFVSLSRELTISLVRKTLHCEVDSSIFKFWHVYYCKWESQPKTNRMGDWETVYIMMRLFTISHLTVCKGFTLFMGLKMLVWKPIIIHYRHYNSFHKKLDLGSAHVC